MQAIAWIRQIVIGSAYTLVGLSSLGDAMAVTEQGEVLYGDDNRRDVYHQDNTELMRAVARSTAVMVPKFAVGPSDSLNETRQIKLRTRPYGRALNLCEDEQFRDQPLAGFCSSFLVAPDIMVTAGHCVQDAMACKSAVFIFDFAYTAEGDDPTLVDIDRAYLCKEIIKVELDHQTGNDFAVIRLNRPVTGREPLAVRRTEKIADEADLTVIGNPSGLPTKIAAGAKVRDNSSANAFIANLDTYQGNSGSAVFSSTTGTVEGILVRGEDDFETNTELGCMASKRCQNDNCSGETVIRATEFSRYLE